MTSPPPLPGARVAEARPGPRGWGLMIVAQLTQDWGTRHTTDGKTIWCAQTLDPSELPSSTVRSARSRSGYSCFSPEA
ncbi:ATP-binding protein [Kitasatospora sp. NPDC058190]|uniref:ATP-binding protein n=1 Tax=Kitasatospora sp. NPDC058190 TaxID=3346371 RepID=UPI0036D8DE3C